MICGKGLSQVLYFIDQEQHAFYPGWQLFSIDGVVMTNTTLAQAEMPSLAGDDLKCGGDSRLPGSVLVHEIGHWMGLYHPFGTKTDCVNADGIADTNMYQDGATKRRCCKQTQCGTGDLWRIQNWMSVCEKRLVNLYRCLHDDKYSECRGTTKANQLTYTGFSKGQRSHMYAHFLTFRRGYNCGAEMKKRAVSNLSPAVWKREEARVNVLAELLLNNCSVAIQDVFDEETIPLPKAALSSLSSAASSLRANPTADDPNNPRPATVTLGTATARASEVSETAATGKSSSNGGSSGNSSDANILTTRLGWALLGSLFAVCFGAMSVHGL